MSASLCDDDRKPPARGTLRIDNSAGMQNVANGEGVVESKIYSKAFMKALEETREALDDVHGTSCKEATISLAQEQSILAVAREKLKLSLARIPKEKREAYDEAMSKAPHLVQIESPCDRFLKALDYDSDATAQSLVNYWKKRLDLFGPQRAFRSMTITGRGALTKEHVYSALCGAFCIMPPDKHHRPILFIDRAKFLTDAEDPLHRIQVLFYFMHLLFLENEDALNNGIVICMSMDSEHSCQVMGLPEDKPTLVERLKAKPLPLKICAVHLIMLKKNSFFEQAIPNWFKMFEESWKWLSMRVIAHVVHSRLEILLALDAYGLTNANIPKELNGSVDLDSVGKWHAERLEIELERYRHFPLANSVFGDDDDDDDDSYDDDDDDEEEGDDEDKDDGKDDAQSRRDDSECKDRASKRPKL